jgi:hypothetical protein
MHTCTHTYTKLWSLCRKIRAKYSAIMADILIIMAGAKTRVKLKATVHHKLAPSLQDAFDRVLGISILKNSEFVLVFLGIKACIHAYIQAKALRDIHCYYPDSKAPHIHMHVCAHWSSNPMHRFYICMHACLYYISRWTEGQLILRYQPTKRVIHPYL